MVNWKSLLTRRYRYWFNKVKKKSRKSYEVKPSLRSPLYIVTAGIQCVWSVVVASYIVEHIVNHQSSRKVNIIASEVNHLFEQLAFVLLPLAFIIPPILSRRRWRSQCVKVINCTIIFVLAVYAVSSICFAAISLISEQIEFFVQLHILVSQTIVAIIVCISLLYLNLRVGGLNLFKDEDFISLQGYIHGAEILVIAGASILSAMDNLIHLEPDHQFTNEAASSDRLSVADAHQELNHYHNVTIRLSEDRLSESDFFRYKKKMHPFFLISFLLLVQYRLVEIFVVGDFMFKSKCLIYFITQSLCVFRHYIFVHCSHIVPGEARERSAKFLSQYNMTPLERDIANSKEPTELLCNFLTSMPFYPRISCGCEGDEDEEEESFSRTKAKPQQEDIFV